MNVLFSETLPSTRLQEGPVPEVLDVNPSHCQTLCLGVQAQVNFWENYAASDVCMGVACCQP